MILLRQEVTVSLTYSQGCSQSLGYMNARMDGLRAQMSSFHSGCPTVVEVNPLCGQRRSLLAQTGSSNNHTMLSRKSLIANTKWMVRTYLDSNASVRRRDVALVPLPWLVTIPTISVIGHLHMQRTT